MDLSIVIAHRGDPLGLWATIQSCEIDLQTSGLNYNYCIVCNGDEKYNGDLFNIFTFLNKTGRIKQLAVHPAPLSPPSARQFASQFADGKYLFFLDNHCLVTPGYFKRAFLDFETYGMDMLHSATRFYAGDATHFHYNLQLEKNFWAASCLHPAHELKPYPIAAGGHGGFAVKRSVWKEVGGYWGGFVGYGGEEIYFDLKMWMLGKTNYLDPRMIHYHYAAANRGYKRHFSDDYYRNMMMCANIIGGEDWTYRVFDSFAKSFKARNDKTMFDLLCEAQLRSNEHAKELAAKRTKTLDELLIWFRDKDISH